MGILTTGNEERQPKIGIVKRELDTLMKEKLCKRNSIPRNEENLKICWKYIFMCLKHMKCSGTSWKQNPNPTNPSFGKETESKANIAFLCQAVSREQS